jgi:glycosyltransferase involved in cell wall biosynthesis
VANTDVADVSSSAALRTLHVSNVANVAYGFAKILNHHGHPASVICHDVKHLMSQPEWDDVWLDPADFPDEADFFNNTADFGGYRRPDWFISESIHDPYAAVGHAHARVRRWLGRLVTPGGRRRLEPWYHRARHWQVGRRVQAAASAQGRNVLDGAAARIAEIVERTRLFGPEWAIRASDVTPYLPHRAWLARHAAGHDVVFTHYRSPIYGMLYGQKPQVSVEIGTMRDFPFNSSVVSKVLWPAYRLSDHVVITNPDNRQLAEAAGIEHYSFCPHPIDGRIFRPGDEPALRAALLERHRASHLLLAPARQNWRIKGNDKLLRAFARVRAAGVNAVLLIPAWGQEILRSQTLARELDLGAHVAWMAPMSEPVLAAHYRAVDLVFDQFQLGVFGLITPKVMACGVPVVTSYEPRHHAWCFAADPPVVAASDDTEIFESTVRLLRDRSARREIGAASCAWVDAHHSSAVVVQALASAARHAAERFGRRAGMKQPA